MERPNATFCNGKFGVLNNFCYAEFLAYYTLESKSTRTCKHQPDELDDKLIENSHEECPYPKNIKLMISGETMRWRKIRRTLRYHVPNKLLSPEKFAHHVLLLFYPFRDERELLSGFPPLHQNKLQEEGVQDVVNINKIKFEPYGDLDQAFSQFNENLINNQDKHSQIENDETPGPEYPNEIIQKKEKQTIILHFPTSCHKYYQMMKSHKFLKFKAKGSLRCGSFMGQRLCKI